MDFENVPQVSTDELAKYLSDAALSLERAEESLSPTLRSCNIFHAQAVLRQVEQLRHSGKVDVLVDVKLNAVIRNLNTRIAQLSDELASQFGPEQSKRRA